jgi:V8-like Glu-specific endopeptidase
MSDQEEQVTNLHTSASNVPEEPGEVSVPEGQEVTEEPFEGEGFEGTQVASPQDVEEVTGYEQMRAPLDRVLMDPNVVLTAPDTTGLRDIAEASFGPLHLGGTNPVVDPVAEAPLVPEVVIGTDDRIQITNTSDYPWRAHASLRITAADNSLWIGTGWFIGPHTLATAGHVVFIYAPGTPRHGWVRSIQVMPGRNGSSLPYGSVTSTDFRSVFGWMQSGDENYDYGAIRIPTELGNTVGWFGFRTFSDSDLLATTGNISGYPGDKPSGTQWYHWRQVASVNSRKVYYQIDTAGGQSGSAVYRFYTPPGGTSGRYGFAVHAYGGATANSGTRIVQPVADNFVAWKA